MEKARFPERRGKFHRDHVELPEQTTFDHQLGKYQRVVNARVGVKLGVPPLNPGFRHHSRMPSKCWAAVIRAFSASAFLTGRPAHRRTANPSRFNAWRGD